MLPPNFKIPTDNKAHSYCLKCMSDSVEPIKKNGRTRYLCKKCSNIDDRTLFFDNQNAWLDSRNNLWHETAAVFVKNNANKYLFFMRTAFPFALTIPAGHVDKGETPYMAATRELKEETGLDLEIVPAFTVDIAGDCCSAGADYHKWYVYLADYNQSQTPVINYEGKDSAWLSLENAKVSNPAYAINFIIDRYLKAQN
jgi:8-oxo-dGTP pyrophosphatase MutT (NUDIX family)